MISSVYSEYARGFAARRKRLTEDAKGDTTSILRAAVHHFGEELRKNENLPDGSPERLKIQAAFDAFRLAKERLKTVSEKIVIEDLLHTISQLDHSEFVNGVGQQLQSILDALPIDSPEIAAPASVPATDAPPPTDADSPSPQGDPALPSDPASDIDFGVSETPGGEDGEVSDDQFKDLVAKLS